MRRSRRFRKDTDGCRFAGCPGMTWLFVNDFSDHSNQSPQKNSGIGHCNDNMQVHSAATSLLAKGSVVAEFDMGAEGRAPTRLIHFISDENWKRRFTIFLNADFSVSVEVQQGLARSYVRLSDWQVRPTGRARLTYAWDAPAKLGLLTIECLETGLASQTLFDCPIPIPRADFEKLAGGKQFTAHDSRLVSVAVSDAIEPIGPAPSICTGALVETEDGPRAIEKLQLGDLILTVNNSFQPIRWIIKQELPEAGSFRPIKLRAPYLGLSQDVTVGQKQRILFEGAEAEYLFGEDAVLIEARQLLGHPSATLLPAAFSRTYYQILLDHHECIQLCGGWSESLFVGRLAEHPQVLATSRLAQLPSSAMPVHRNYIRPMLRNYETRTLLDTLSA
jgi:hypothetical protein